MPLRGRYTVSHAIKKITFSWTSNAEGAATATTKDSYEGILESAVFVPDGSAVPSDQYDVVITDENGLDVLKGEGANRSNSVTQRIQPKTPIANSKLTLVVSNAGSEKKGEVYLYLR